MSQNGTYFSKASYVDTRRARSVRHSIHRPPASFLVSPHAVPAAPDHAAPHSLSLMTSLDSQLLQQPALTGQLPGVTPCSVFYPLPRLPMLGALAGLTGQAASPPSHPPGHGGALPTLSPTKYGDNMTHNEVCFRKRLF